MAEREVDIRIVAKNVTQAAFNAVKDGLRAIGVTARQTGQQTSQVFGRDFVGEVARARQEVQALSPAMRAQIEAARQLGLSHRDIAKDLGISGGAMRAYVAESRAAAKSQETLATSLNLVRGLLPGLTIAGLTAGLVRLGRAAFDSAGQILDLHHKTGLSTRTIQEMQQVANQTGSSIENFTNAAFKLGVNVSEGLTKTRDAVRDLGLSYEDLRRMSPDDQFRTVVRALEGIQSQTERNRIGVALFGRQFGDIAAAIEEGYTGIAAQARLSTDAQLEALDRAGDAWQQFKDDVASATRSALGSVVLFVQDAKAELSSLRNLAPRELASMLAVVVTGGFSPGQIVAGLAAAGAASRQAGKDIDLAAETAAGGVESYRMQLAAARSEVAKLTAAQRDELTAALAIGGEAAKDYAASIGLSETALRLFQSSAKDGTKDAEAFRKAQDALFGRDLIARAHEMMRQLGAVANVTKLTAEKKAELHKAVTAALDAYKALGQEAPAALRAIDAATRPLVTSTHQWAFVELKAAVDNTTPFEASVRSLGIESVPLLSAAIHSSRLGFVGYKEAVADSREEIRRLREESQTTSEALKAGLLKTLQSIPDTIAQALVFGGSIKNALRSITSQVGKGLGQMAAKALGFAGPWGQAIGGAIGSLAPMLISGIGRLFSGRPVHEDIRRRVAGWAGPISEGLAKAIAESAKQFGGNRQAAEIFNLDQIIGETGGLTEANLRTMTARLHDVFSMIETGAFSAAQGTAVLDKNFQAFVETAKRNKGLISAELREIIALDEQFGTRSAAIAEHVKTSLGAGIAHLTTFLQASTAAAKTSSQELQAELDRAMAERARMRPTDDPARFEELSRQIDELQKKLASAQALQAGLAITSETSANAFAAAIAGSFQRLLAQGIDPMTAIEQVMPAVDALQAQLDGLGLDGGAAFASLRAQIALTQDAVAGPLLQGVRSITGGIVELYNGGVLTADMFQGMTAQIGQAYQQLKAEGKGGVQALGLLKPQLQQIWELQQRFGIEVDEATQAMLDEAEAAGLVGEAHKSASERMVDGIGKVVDRLDTLLTAMGVTLPEKVGEGARAIVDKMREGGRAVDDVITRIPRRIGIDIDFNVEDPDLPTPSVPGAAAGVFATKPTLRVFGEGGEPELGGPVSFMTKALTGALEPVGAGGGSRSDAARPSVTVLPLVHVGAGGLDYADINRHLASAAGISGNDFGLREIIEDIARIVVRREMNRRG